jgi:hypothetical protein
VGFWVVTLYSFVGRASTFWRNMMLPSSWLRVQGKELAQPLHFKLEGGGGMIL